MIANRFAIEEERDLDFIATALVCARGEYEKYAKAFRESAACDSKTDGHSRVADQFDKQAADCTRIIDMIEGRA